MTDLDLMRLIAELRRRMPHGEANDNDADIEVDDQPASADYLRGYRKGLEAAILLVERRWAEAST